MRKNIAIITARAGSKRIKNKNLLNFFGKPIIAYSILAAKKTNIFDEVYVSTDSKKIEKISKKFGAKVPSLREKKLSDDLTGTHSVVSGFLKKIDLRNVDNICCLYPTAPLMKHTDIIRGSKILKKNKKSYIFSGVKVEINNFSYFSLNKNNFLKDINHVNYEIKNKKSILYTDAAQFYWASKNTWLKNTKIISNKSKIIEIPFERVHDLNSPLDLKILRLKKDKLK
jgi:N-acylneuraminate cytidylyltransferase